MGFARRKKPIDGIESMPKNALFVGDAMEIDDWEKAVVWTPEPIDVKDSVSIVQTEPADGTAPAVTAAGEDKNEQVEEWNKVHLRR